MEKNPQDTRVQIALGNIVALNAAVAALYNAHPDKAALETALDEFQALSNDIIRTMELHHQGSGEAMQDTYLQQIAGYRQLLRP